MSSGYTSFIHVHAVAGVSLTVWRRQGIIAMKTGDGQKFQATKYGNVIV